MLVQTISECVGALLFTINFNVQLFSQVFNNTPYTSYDIIHLASHDVTFLYLYNADIDRDLISLEITPHSLLADGKLFTANISSALKTQGALLQLPVFITFPLCIYFINSSDRVVVALPFYQKFSK